MAPHNFSSGVSESDRDIDGYRINTHDILSSDNVSSSVTHSIGSFEERVVLHSFFGELSTTGEVSDLFDKKSIHNS